MVKFSGECFERPRPEIHAMWSWANVLLFEKCQAAFCHISVRLGANLVC